MNIRKESLRLIRSTEKSSPTQQVPVKNFGDGDVVRKSTNYNIEFIFDCDVRCAITIYYFCTEEVTSKGVM